MLTVRYSNRRSIGVLLCLGILSLFTMEGRGQEWLCPIAGKGAGECVMLRPGDRIGELQNNSKVVFTAEANWPVVMPAGGVVISVRYDYWYNFDLSHSWTIDASLPIRERESRIQDFAHSLGVSLRHVVATVTVEAGSVCLLVSGVHLDSTIRVGDRVQRGDTLGLMGYFLDRIDRPNVAVEVMLNGVAVDPSRYFGLPKRDEKGRDLPSTQFKKRFLPSEMRDDLEMIHAAVVEGDPSAFDYVTPFDLDTLYYSLRNSLRGSLDVEYFRPIANRLVKFFRDPELLLDMRIGVDTGMYFSRFPLIFGVLHDSLVVTWNGFGYDQMVGQRIVQVDGIPADTIVRFVKQATRGDQGIWSGGGQIDILQQFVDFASGSFLYYWWYHRKDSNADVSITLQNGLTVSYVALPADQGYTASYAPSFLPYLEAQTSKKMEMRSVAPSVGYLAVRQFDFSRGEFHTIRKFIDSLHMARVGSLIVDVRGCSEGTVSDVVRLFSMLALQPFRDHLYTSVRHRGDLRFSRDSSVYLDSAHFFLAHTDSSSGKEYRRYNTVLELPDGEHHYGGQLYVLTNEWTASVGALFAALAVKYERGVLVGRETNTPYYAFSSGPFATVVLPWSQFVLHVPLVKCVFDTVKHPRIPFGRGVIPDHSIDYSIRELSGACEDSILSYTLALIEREGGMLGAERLIGSQLKWMLVWLLVAASVLLMILRVRHRV